jgi:hypothetical protein
MLIIIIIIIIIIASLGFEETKVKKGNRPIYLDMQATTPTDPRVLDAMMPHLTQQHGNPHSRTHAYGWEAEKAVEKARQVYKYFSLKKNLNNYISELLKNIYLFIASCRFNRSGF